MPLLHYSYTHLFYVTLYYTSNLSDLYEGIIAKDTAKFVGNRAAVDTRVGVASRGDLKDWTIGVSQLLVVLIPTETLVVKCVHVYVYEDMFVSE